MDFPDEFTSVVEPKYTTSVPSFEKFLESLLNERDDYLAKTTSKQESVTAQKLFKSVLNFKNMVASSDEANTWFISFKTESDFNFKNFLDGVFKNKNFFTVKHANNATTLTDGSMSVYTITWKGMKLKVIWHQG